MLKWLFGFFILYFTASSQANVVILGTRIVYPQDKKNISIQLENNGDRPALVQAWLDDGRTNVDPSTIKLPFIITPPVSRMEAKSQQVLRIRYTGEALAQDRESLFYFNLFDIPPKPSKKELDKNPNYLQFAVNNRLKFFFRPTSLPYPVSDAYQKVQWSVNGKKLVVKNPTPYHITYLEIELKQGKKVYKVKNADMVAPFAEAQFDLVQPVKGKADVHWHVINDYGGKFSGQSTL
ncbi:fimbrial biogenesis chaperone [Pasteurella sp. PK-2025]|uniref:fimbrial biogenesis chaperone n=1 Tax=unclassified Pasteurella TaxID=2621516 RepID=UPI003C765382